MSNDEADELMESFQRWDAKTARSSFIHKMERKLSRKERRV
jgi:hypothetical protein